MRKLDWTDYRQAKEKFNGSDFLAVKKLSEKWPLAEIFAAQEEFNARAKNPDIEEAMMRQNHPYSAGDPKDLQLLKENGEALAGVIRAGGNK